MFNFLKMSLLGLWLCDFVNDFCYNMLGGIGLCIRLVLVNKMCIQWQNILSSLLNHMVKNLGK